MCNFSIILGHTKEIGVPADLKRKTKLKEELVGYGKGEDEGEAAGAFVLPICH